MKCFWKLVLPGLLLLGGLIFSGIWSTRHVESRLGVRAPGCLDRGGVSGVSLLKMDGQDAYLAGPANLEEAATAALKGCGHQGYGKVFYEPSAPVVTTVAPAPATTAAPTTTIVVTTTAPPAPTTTVVPTTTVAPTATAAPTTTAAPKPACPADLPLSTQTKFESTLAAITAESKPVLDQIAGSLKTSPACKINIVGHTDNRGSDAYTPQLSEERANAVRDYLISQGANGANITAEGRGESQPVPGTDQSTEAGLAANRRIEFQKLT